MKRILMPMIAAFALATSANAGLTITEIMANPQGADEFGEWFDSESLPGHLVLIKFFRAHW